MKEAREETRTRKVEREEDVRVREKGRKVGTGGRERVSFKMKDCFNTLQYDHFVK